MTIPAERTRAVLSAGQFLFDLLDTKKTPRVPRDIRQRASRILRHYPGVVDMQFSSELASDIWGKPE